jgi:hypothetical protein
MNAVLPCSFAYYVARFVEESALAVLFAKDPLTFVILSRREQETTDAMLAAVLILPPVRGAVDPREVALTVHFSFLPIPIVPRLIWKNSDPLPMRGEGSSIDVTVVLASISVLDFRFSLRKVIDSYGIGFAWVMRTMKHDLASLRIRICHSPFESITAICASNPAVPLSFALSQLSFIFDLLPKQLDRSVPTWQFIKLSVIEEIVRYKENSFSLRKSIFIPLSDIVLIVKSMFHHLLLLKNLTVIFNNLIFYLQIFLTDLSCSQCSHPTASHGYSTPCYSEEQLTRVLADRWNHA